MGQGGGGSPSLRRLRPSPTLTVSAPAKVSVPANADIFKTSWPPYALAPYNQVSSRNGGHVGEGSPTPGDGFNPAAPGWVHKLSLTSKSQFPHPLT